ncbi:unnamed protein product, partial [Dicrocoelium dendriticum]
MVEQFEHGLTDSSISIMSARVVLTLFFVRLFVSQLVSVAQTPTPDNSDNSSSTESNMTTTTEAIFVEEELKWCKYEEENVTLGQDVEGCQVRRQNMAARQHVAVLIPYNTNDPLDLTCQVCRGDDFTKMKWFWVPREKSGSIFLPEQLTDASRIWLLNRTMLEPVETEYFSGDIKSPCLSLKTFTLRYLRFNASKNLGTYVCMQRELDEHPLNQIWYHVDTITPVQDTVDLTVLPPQMEMNSRVDSFEQIPALQKILDDDLAALPDFQDFRYDPLHLTSRVYNNMPKTALCGEVEIRGYRSCFIRIEPDVVDQLYSDDEDAKLIYFVLRFAFDFLVSPQYATTQGERTARENAVKQRVKELGFYHHVNDTDIFVPCQYTMFKHLPNLNNQFRPLETRGLFTKMVYDFACPEMDPMDLINLALDRDVTRMQVHLLGIDDMRFMKIERVVVDGTESVRLSCNLDKPTDCSGVRDDVLWRSKTGLSFSRRTMMDERIYVTGKCELVFQIVALNDSGEYQCFLRHTKNPSKWAPSPHIVYRVKIEKGSYKLPAINDIYVGLAILIGWAAAITVVWMILMVFNHHVHTVALTVAKARQKIMQEELERKNLEILERLKVYLHELGITDEVIIQERGQDLEKVQPGDDELDIDNEENDVKDDWVDNFSEVESYTEWVSDEEQRESPHSSALSGYPT